MTEMLVPCCDSGCCKQKGAALAHVQAQGTGEGAEPFRVDWCFLHNLQCAIKAGLEVAGVKAVLKKINRFVTALKRSSRCAILF